MSCYQHPGGEEVLLDEGAKDATEAFEDVGHSDEARELLEKYYVGDLDKSVSLTWPKSSEALTDDLSILFFSRPKLTLITTMNSLFQ